MSAFRTLSLLTGPQFGIGKEAGVRDGGGAGGGKGCNKGAPYGRCRLTAG